MKNLFFTLLSLCGSFLFAQDAFELAPRPSLNISRSLMPITLDGYLDEAAWEDADLATNFWQKTPRNDLRAVNRTEVRLTYDDQFLYVGGRCYGDPNWIISTLKRDEFWDSDGFAFVLDPLNAATTGYMFMTNPYGSQSDVLLGGGTGGENYNGEWDNRWYVEAQILEDSWSFEMAIPFKTLRYEAGQTQWGINFGRNDKQSNLFDTWAQIPLQFWIIDLGYTGQLNWDEAPPNTGGGNVAFIPYINTNYNQDFTEGDAGEFGLSLGADAKIALSPSLNLDLTVNPDFSQVEVDQQVTNLTRFSIFLPERRTFFLENSDVFNRFGNGQTRPFFSRRIGLGEDGSAVPIDFGARLTGNITPSTRIGLLNVQTKAVGEQSGQNYGALAFSQRIFQRSTIRGLFTNRQALNYEGPNEETYGRNASLEVDLQTPDGRWRGGGGYHHSFEPGINEDNHFWSLNAGYSGQVFSSSINWINVGTNYAADVGFVNRLENYDAIRDTSIRLGYRQLIVPFRVNIVPKNSRWINQHRINFENNLFLDPEFEFVERSHELSYSIDLSNSSNFRVEAAFNETDLRFPFSFTDGEPLPVGRYNYQTVGLSYDSDERKLFQYDVGALNGSFYNGTINAIEAGISYRRQPWGNFRLGFEYNRLAFPDAFGSTTIWAFSPRMEISFNRNLFWTLFLQYNTQADNLNINSRFQWRFAPMSDIFLVYTDNYAVNDFGPKNRALVFKVNYWLVI